MFCRPSANANVRDGSIAGGNRYCRAERKQHRTDTKTASTAATEKRSVWGGGEIFCLRRLSGILLDYKSVVYDIGHLFVTTHQNPADNFEFEQHRRQRSPDQTC
jgi:hypothetical protein